MNAILDQLGLDYTFFIQLGLFIAAYFVLSTVYFRPFLRLFEVRHKKTVEDREAAEKLLSQAQARLQEYKTRIAEERLAARKEYEAALDQAKKEESQVLSQARNEAKAITQEALQSLEQQKQQLQKQLELEVEALAQRVSDQLLIRQD